ncbi:hypothetical protein GT360_17870 [Vibrio astriarenae]|uniref:MotA/TolQ/ExbB proton channel domain-containing protein n=1 Tax=Vibrio astriarenae TaxID=1481923 RepID=A0A7Z2T729_9VIBR|nr:hypothetical protein [Vibrio astriarenae]QIA65408.1 hypothetical protein GT360_17870 [Vibrio astriarenae]
MGLITSSSLNYLILILSVLALAIGLGAGIFLCNKEPRSNKIAAIPSLLTSGGVLFTFLGIALGLLNFDPNDLNNSISTLLSGLTLAFWSSIFGMAFSIIFRLKWLPEHQKTLSSVTPGQMLTVLSSQKYNLERLNSQASCQRKENKELFDALIEEVKAVGMVTSAGNSQSNENIENLTQEIHQFASSVSSQTSHQIAESLRSSIEGFNQGLMGQFGSNFQRLDKSVAKMLDWQKQYMLQVEQLTNAFEHAVESVTATEQSLGIISLHTEAIPNAMGKLSSTTDSWKQQVDDLDQRLEAFSRMRDQAVNAMPEIQNQLDALCQRVDKSILNTCESLEKGVLKVSSELQEKALVLSDKLVEATDGIGGDLSNASGQIESMTNHLAASSDKIKTTLEDSIGQLEARLNSLLNGTKDEVNDISTTLQQVNKNLIEKHQEQIDKSSALLTQAHDVIDKRMEDSMNLQMKGSLQIQKTIESKLIESSSVFQQNIKTELEGVLNDLGSGLVQITEEFCTIYSRLAEEMERIEISDSLDKAS